MFICSSSSFFASYAQRPMALWIHSPTSTGALQECRQASFKAPKNANKMRMCFWDPSCRRLADFVWPRASLPKTTKDKPAYCCTPIIDGKKTFRGPWSATCGRVGLVTLKTPRASPWCERASAKLMGSPVWLSAEATSAGRCWAW